jgi:hypothetical protein
VTGIPDRLTAALANRYRIERELGSGGMATVYLARDLKADRQAELMRLAAIQGWSALRVSAEGRGIHDV